MKMPAPDQRTLARRADIVAALRSIVPDGVIDDLEARRVYERDGLSAYRQIPMGVVLPSNVDQDSAVLGYCREHGVEVVPRGAGSRLSGGAVPLTDGVLLGMAEFNK